jgi:hypothetical protein
MAPGMGAMLGAGAARATFAATLGADAEGDPGTQAEQERGAQGETHEERRHRGLVS